MTRDQLPNRTRRVFVELRDLEPPSDLLTAVVSEATATPQVRGLWWGLRQPAVALGVAAVVVLLAVATIPRLGILDMFGQPGPSGSRNPHAMPVDIAELPTAAAVAGEIALAGGGYPAGADADSVWIANERSGELAQLDIASGSIAASAAINPPTSEAYMLGAAPDGLSIWVTGLRDRSLVRVDADPLAVTRRFPIGAVPYRIAPDGDRVWVTDFNGSQVLQVDATDGSVELRIIIQRPTGIAVATDAVWVATYNGELVRLDRADGSILHRSPIAEDATDVQVHDGDVWITGIHNRRLERYDPEADAIVAWTDGVTALAFIGDVPWVATTRSALVKLDPDTLAWAGAVAVEAELDQMVTAGGELWVVGTRDGNSVLFRIQPDTR